MSCMRRVRDALREYLTAEKLDELAAAAYAAYEQEQTPASDRELLEHELADVEKKIENVVQAIVNGVQLDNLNATVEELKARREQAPGISRYHSDSIAEADL